MGFWQFATGGGSGGGTGDVVGPASSTDNAVARWNLATGKLLQDSALTVSDVAGGVVTLATTAGNALAIANTDPAATTGASVAGDPLTITAGNAVASTDTAGAAAGGALTFTAGNAARLTSGNANGGAVNLFPGTGIGTGVRGTIRLFASSTSGQALKNITDVGSGYSGLGIKKGDDSAYDEVWANGFHEDGEQVTINSAGLYLRTAITGVFSTAGAHGNNPSAYDTGLYASAAGVWSAIKSSNSAPGAILSAALVEANTAGSGTPNAIAATESGTVFTNEGSGAKNYEALPTAVAGYKFTFIVQDADGMRIVANTGDTIRVIDKVTAAAGYIESTTIGSTVTLVSVNAVEWYAIAIKGTWTDGTFTYDDTSLTTP